MKKSTIIFVCSGAILVIAALSVMYANVFLSHLHIIESGKNYKEEAISSNDDKFTLYTKVFDEDNMTYISFYIEESAENKVVFLCEDKYRAYDFKGVEWDNLNVVVNSGDVGSVEYFYENGAWGKKPA